MMIFSGERLFEKTSPGTPTPKTFKQKSGWERVNTNNLFELYLVE